MSRVFILQSGFVTMLGTYLNRSEEADLSFKDSLYATDYRVIDTENYYDSGVESLFHQWRHDNNVMLKFEFREAVLKLALRLFHSGTIMPWLRLQLSQRTVGYLHRKFLKEVLASVLNKEPKTLDNYQYYRLLSVSKDTAMSVMDDKDVDDLLKEYVKQNTSSNVTDLLYMWTKDVHGYADLLSTLHVIFGRRHGYSDVGQKGE